MIFTAIAINTVKWNVMDYSFRAYYCEMRRNILAFNLFCSHPKQRDECTSTIAIVSSIPEFGFEETFQAGEGLPSADVKRGSSTPPNSVQLVGAVAASALASSGVDDVEKKRYCLQCRKSEIMLRAIHNQSVENVRIIDLSPVRPYQLEEERSALLTSYKEEFRTAENLVHRSDYL